MGRFGFRSCVDDFTRVYIPERNGARTSTIFHDLNPQAAFLMNWHIEVIAAKLAALAQGKIQQLIINLPPRHLKSLLVSIAFPAWCLGHDPRPRCCASAMPRITPAALASGRRKHPLAIAKSTGCRGPY
jgi:hypothetical protein